MKSFFLSTTVTGEGGTREALKKNEFEWNVFYFIEIHFLKSGAITGGAGSSSA